MSFATLFGIMLSILLFISSILISTSNFQLFLSLSSFIMVVGGTCTSCFIAYEPRYVVLAMKLVPRVFTAPPIGRHVLSNEVGRMVKWAYTAQKKGLPGLEGELKNVVRGDALLLFSSNVLLSGYTPPEVRTIVENFVNSTYGRNTVPINILKYMGTAAPAFGMVGTLVGLIVMLESLSGDMGVLGRGMALAMLTTLYGVMSARLLFVPIAAKLMQREQIIRFRGMLVAEGVSLIAEQRSPRYIQDRLNSFLDPQIHFNIDRGRKT